MIKTRADGTKYDSTGHGKYDEQLAAIAPSIELFTGAAFARTWRNFWISFPDTVLAPRKK